MEVQRSAADAAPALSSDTQAAVTTEADCTRPSFVTSRSEYSAPLVREASGAVPASRRGRSANWVLGLRAGDAANLMNVAVMMKEDWAAITSEHIVHCWTKVEGLGKIRRHNFLREHREYGRPIQAVFTRRGRGALHAEGHSGGRHDARGVEHRRETDGVGRETTHYNGETGMIIEKFIPSIANLQKLAVAEPLQ